LVIQQQPTHDEQYSSPVDEDFLGGCGTGVCLGSYPLHHVRVMQFENRSLGVDLGQFGEVVPRWWARGGPFQGVAIPHGSSMVMISP
jgi:hypothetical protein